MRHIIITLKLSVLLIGIVTMIWFIGCEDVTTTSKDEPEQPTQTIPEMASLEQTLSDLAELIPEALTDPGLAKIVWDEAKSNEEDEPYALWSKIADIPTPSGVTLRSKIRDIRLRRSRGKVAVDAESFTSSLDDVEYLQVYIHDFEDWDSTLTLPTTFTPLTINDIDVTELTLYDSLGNTTILEVDTVGPVYPIAIIGINETMGMDTTGNDVALGKIVTGEQVKITKIKLKRSAWWYEPWWLGKAEIYFVYFVPTERNSLSDWIESNNGSASLLIPDEWWNLAIGERTNYKQYRCWKRRWYGYTQNKPWRTMNYNTGWSPNDLDYSKNYRLKVIEYDWPGYDRGVDFWCLMAGVDVGTDVTTATGGNVLLGIAAGIGTALVCDLFIINDDQVGGKTGFQNKVNEANNAQGTIIQWNDSDWEIKLKVE